MDAWIHGWLDETMDVYGYKDGWIDARMDVRMD